MKYDLNRAAVTLSVTELCSLALTRGDLDLRPGFGKSFSPDRAKIGTEVHQKLQAEAGALYTAEVAMTNTTFYEGLSYEVSGRADGIIRTDPATVDEIKTVSGKAFSLPPSPLHEAQAKCYAHFLCVEKGLEEVNVRLTYYRIEDKKTRYSVKRFRAGELREFYLSLLSAVRYRAEILFERETVRVPSVAGGRFPYPTVREGQDIMLRECYRDIKAGKRLFIEAPTGTGKTLSSLYPAVRCVGEGIVNKIFYLTAKASTRREAFRAAEQIFKAGSHLRTVVLTAREQLCLCDAARNDPNGVSRHCNPFDCPYAKGYYDKRGEVIRELTGARNGFPKQTVLDAAKAYGICPYELQLDLSEFCDIVICDYNYVFDPQVYLRRYFDEPACDANKYVFLVDEAHNLADRAATMYSAELRASDVAEVYRQLQESEEKLRLALEKVTVTMIGFRRLCRDTLEKDENGVEHGYYTGRNAIEPFHRLIAETRQTIDAWLRANRGHPAEPAVWTLSGRFKHFETVTELYDEHFLTFAEMHGEERILRLLCLDPSRVLDTREAKASACVLFSATLTPPDYFADILGGGKGAVRVSLPSPFDPKNVCLAAVTGISTRYADREKSCKKVASVIAAAVSGKAGNYIVYFPSYDYLEAVAKVFSEKYPRVPTVRQTRGMNGSEKDRFLDAFREDGKLRVGFCVLGGSFSEGVDLPGGRLIGTVILGTGLPGLSSERNILRDYYDVTRERGYDYAYTYPGFNRVLQAAGRVIRREDDRGVIVLVDDRYATPAVKALFPDHWAGMQYAGNASELADLVSMFWNGV